MRKILHIVYGMSIAFCMFSLSVNTAESADWSLVMENAEATFYVDNETSAKNTAGAKLARELKVLKNHKEITRVLTHSEYNCNDRKKRIFLTLTTYKTGETSLISSKDPNWEIVSSDPGVKAFFQSACK